MNARYPDDEFGLNSGRGYCEHYPTVIAAALPRFRFHLPALKGKIRKFIGGQPVDTQPSAPKRDSLLFLVEFHVVNVLR